MLNGIAKTIRKPDEIIFIDIDSHNTNLVKIIGAFSNNFTGNMTILKKTAYIHDLWKSRTLKADAILNGGNLFPNHGAEFPSYLVDKDFNEIEFNVINRRKNYEKYYILNLIRLHHSGFNTFNLYKAVDFIYESEKNIYEQINNFIHDWYALKTADWIDSAILSYVFQGIDLEKDLKSDLEVTQEDENNFFIVPEGVFIGSTKLYYNFYSMKTAKIKEIIKSEKINAGRTLNSIFLDAKKDIREVTLYGN